MIRDKEVTSPLSACSTNFTVLAFIYREPNTYLISLHIEGQSRTEAESKD
jgi:hypothetical protein